MREDTHAWDDNLIIVCLFGTPMKNCAKRKKEEKTLNFTYLHSSIGYLLVSKCLINPRISARSVLLLKLKTTWFLIGSLLETYFEINVDVCINKINETVFNWYFSSMFQYSNSFWCHLLRGILIFIGWLVLPSFFFINFLQCL